jgi:hypothetical protein
MRNVTRVPGALALPKLVPKLPKLVPGALALPAAASEWLDRPKHHHHHHRCQPFLRLHSKHRRSRQTQVLHRLGRRPHPPLLPRGPLSGTFLCRAPRVSYLSVNSPCQLFAVSGICSVHRSVHQEASRARHAKSGFAHMHHKRGKFPSLASSLDPSLDPSFDPSFDRCRYTQGPPKEQVSVSRA